MTLRLTQNSRNKPRACWALSKRKETFRFVSRSVRCTPCPVWEHPGKLPQAVSPPWELWTCRWLNLHVMLYVLSYQTVENVKVAYRTRDKLGLSLNTCSPSTLPSPGYLCLTDSRPSAVVRSSSENICWWKWLRCAQLLARWHVHFAALFLRLEVPTTGHTAYTCRKEQLKKWWG